VPRLGHGPSEAAREEAFAHLTLIPGVT
jgi:hypothetical protein